MKKLSDLKVGNIAIVQRNNACGQVKRKMLDMGIYAGSQLKVTNIATLGDPIELEIMGSKVSIRKNEAELVEVE